MAFGFPYGMLRAFLKGGPMNSARTVLLLVALSAPFGLQADTPADVERCGAIEDDAARLVCFDALVPKAAPAADGGAWEVSRDVDPMTSAAKLVLMLKASESVRDRFGRENWPHLLLACRNGKTDLYLAAGEFLTVGQIEVASRIDDRAPGSNSWNTSTDNKAAFHPNPIQAARQLAEASTYRLRLTPHSQSPKDYVFDVRGLSAHLPELAELCGWK
jgi:type VI secretion system protein VasI